VNNKKSAALSMVFLAVMVVITYLPVAILTVYSFTDSSTIGVWSGFSFDLYRQLFTDREIMEALKNTLIVGLSASLLSVVLGTMASIGIQSMKKIPKTIMEGTNQITMVNADIVTAVGFMLLFLLVIVIPDDYVTLIIAHTVICTPYVVMSVMPRLTQLNPNVYEAGLDLGATPMRAIVRIILPQLIPGIIAGFALAFTISLDDFTISTLVSSSVETIPRFLYNKLKVKGVMPVLRALSVVIMAAVMAVLAAINAATGRAEKKRIEMQKLIGR
jgi:spermidine/putrescine transport system permease protein